MRSKLAADVASRPLDPESVATYEGTNQIHTLIIGQALTGHPAFE